MEPPPSFLAPTLSLQLTFYRLESREEAEKVGEIDGERIETCVLRHV